MTVDEFLGWAEGREGRWELVDGELVEKTPERPIHTETKLAAVSALKGAIRRAGARHHVAHDGGTVRVAPMTAFEPDVVAYGGPRLPPDSYEVREPVILVEVLSEATTLRDTGPKRSGYFSVPSVAHYLVLDPERRVTVHHARGEDGGVETRILTDGPLRLDPPGLALFVEELFPSA
jgi:Uma2 family endonuclease